VEDGGKKPLPFHELLIGRLDRKDGLLKGQRLVSVQEMGKNPQNVKF
jgi:hypothetical protein